MSKKQTDLLMSVNEKVLPYLKDAILIVGGDGEIINGNEYAYSMLGIKASKLSIYAYLNLGELDEYQRAPIVVKHKNKELVFEVISVKITESIYYLIMQDLLVANQTSWIKKYVSDRLPRSSEGIMIYEKDRLIDGDEILARMFGYSRTDLRGISLRTLIKKDVRPFSLYSHSTIHKGKRKDGTSFFFKLIEYPYYDENNTTRTAIIWDVTEQVNQEKKIEQLAYFDELTGLPNLKFFIQALQEAIQGDNALAVYYVDLDYFKEVNETFGYEFGDKLLKSCANRITALLNHHTFLSRISTDEFLIFQQQVSYKEKGVHFAKKIINAFKDPINIDDYEIYISVCIGISLYPEHGKTPIDLIKHADSAMYDIKDKFQNQYNVFTPSITLKFKKTLAMENELRNALKNDEFELFYQPQKDLHTGKVVGFEALLRWKHPVKGYILPGEFIPLAERTGLIIEMGDWVLKEACRQGKVWQDEGYEPVIVSVNMSAKQIHQPDLVDKVQRVLDDTGLEAHYLELEITESMAMTNEKLILSTMQELKELGVNVSIDDFGTGYSSFKYLSVFPISKLKIDRMFLSDQQDHNQAIVKSIIHMSHSLNLRVIAEGVETQSQFEFLKGEKCDEMQGYYFSEPLPPQKLIPFLNTI